MSEQIFADVTRDGATQFTAIPMEVHYETDMEQHAMGGMKPFYRYLIIVWQLLDIHQNDYLVNVKRIDPLTSQPVAWVDASGAPDNILVATIPERLPDAHIEFRGNNARTTGFG